MARTADKPGTFRIVPKRGAFLLSGVRADGRRVKIHGLSHTEAAETADRLFPRIDNASTVSAQPVSAQVDDYGLPPLSVSPTVASATTPPPPPPQPSPDSIIESREKEVKKAERASQARSLMEFAGIVWATGDVWIGRKITERAGCEPVMPNAKQVRDLRDTTKETLTDLFGDKEIKPWQMMILLSLAIPMSMLIQSPKRKLPPQSEKPTEESSTATSPPLRSV